jgi:hypothetical protein
MKGCPATALSFPVKNTGVVAPAIDSYDFSMTAALAESAADKTSALFGGKYA